MVCNPSTLDDLLCDRTSRLLPRVGDDYARSLVSQRDRDRAPIPPPAPVTNVTFPLSPATTVPDRGSLINVCPSRPRPFAPKRDDSHHHRISSCPTPQSPRAPRTRRRAVRRSTGTGSLDGHAGISGAFGGRTASLRRASRLRNRTPPRGHVRPLDVACGTSASGGSAYSCYKRRHHWRCLRAALRGDSLPSPLTSSRPFSGAAVPAAFFFALRRTFFVWLSKLVTRRVKVSHDYNRLAMKRPIHTESARGRNATGTGENFMAGGWVPVTPAVLARLGPSSGRPTHWRGGRHP